MSAARSTAAVLLAHVAAVAFLIGCGPPHRPWLRGAACGLCLLVGVLGPGSRLPPTLWRFAASCALAGGVLVGSLAGWPSPCAQVLLVLWSIRVGLDVVDLLPPISGRGRHQAARALAESAQALAESAERTPRVLTPGEARALRYGVPFLTGKGVASA